MAWSLVADDSGVLPSVSLIASVTDSPKRTRIFIGWLAERMAAVISNPPCSSFPKSSKIPAWFVLRVLNMQFWSEATVICPEKSLSKFSGWRTLSPSESDIHTMREGRIYCIVRESFVHRSDTPFCKILFCAMADRPICKSKNKSNSFLYVIGL